MAIFNVAKGHTGIDFANDTIKACLMKSAFVPNPDADTLDIALNGLECDAVDYTRVTLTNKAVVFDDTVDAANHTADDIAFTINSDVGTVNQVLVYKEVTDDTDSIPIAVLNFATTRSTGPGQTISTAFPNGVVYSGRST